MITTFRFEKIAVLPLDREQDDFYNDTTDGWKKKADIKEEKKLIKKIKITDNHSFTIQTLTP